ncbi:serine/threonine-protein kinase nek1 [Plakobranchus ocellatus]|uniref:non-specific serine/threonine protein kinase n=1 Tax=Plakobranchus ocellatus TaxID=259542 RepID=A0AAV4BU40_9GAST|nr:serine/threonine-protein kinase nek1 [Plakobranchus ocellatus]
MEDIDYLLISSSDKEYENLERDPLYQLYKKQTEEPSLPFPTPSDNVKPQLKPENHIDIYQQLTSGERAILKDLCLNLHAVLKSGVYRCSNSAELKPNANMMAKITKTTDGDHPYSQFAKEVNVLKQLKDLSVTRFIYAKQYSDFQLDIVVTEFYPGGTLTESIRSKKMCSLLAMSVTFFSLCATLRDIHIRKIVHRDINTDNILMKLSGQPVFSGFHSAVQLQGEDNLVYGVVGKSPFIAPEIKENTKGHHNGFKADVYSLGMVLLKLLFPVDFEATPREMLDVLHNANIPNDSILSVFHTISYHIRDVHQSFEEAFQIDTLKEFELIDSIFLSHVDDIMSELGILEDQKPIVSSSQQEKEEMLPHSISPDLSTLEKLLEELSPTATTSTRESISPVS